jgi:Flp pilus assembly secretin CpaC
VPLLGRIPIIKYAFSSKSRSRNHKNLLIFITPSIIDPKRGGLPNEPESVVPKRPDAMMPQRPQLDQSGQLVGGPSAVPGALAYLERECEIIQRTINEARHREADSQKLTDMKKALSVLQGQVEQMALQCPDQGGVLSQGLVQIADLLERVSLMKRQVLKKSYY